MSTNHSTIFIDEYDYTLPDARIAKYPLPGRDASKLLIYKNEDICESQFRAISNFLPENCLLVYNNTRVIQARLVFHKTTGARIEVFCLEPLLPADYSLSLGATHRCEWKCMVGNLKKWKEGPLVKQVARNGQSCTFSAELIASEGHTHTIRFCWDNPLIHFADLLDMAGELPIPPYLDRDTEESDLINYQTVYSKIKGSVAAPTAGLHFTDEVFKTLETKHIITEEVTLHVGAGTFQPVKTRDIAEHQMHTEVISVQRTAIEHLQQQLGRIIAVGTTSVRTLESLYHIGKILHQNPQATTFHVEQWAPYETSNTLTAHDALQHILDYLDTHALNQLHAETQIMIRPGYDFKMVNGIITNFHQPKSTLLLLVSAFVNGQWKKLYDYALEHDFRFLSYGDSSLLLR